MHIHFKICYENILKHPQEDLGAISMIMQHKPGTCNQLIGHQGPLLLTWFNFNPSMDK